MCKLKNIKPPNMIPHMFITNENIHSNARDKNGYLMPNIWVKKNHHTRGEQLKIATYNVRTLLKDEHVQELEDELKENNMKWDVIGLGEV